MNQQVKHDKLLTTPTTPRTRKRRLPFSNLGPYVFLKSIDMEAVHLAFTLRCLSRDGRKSGRRVSALDKKYFGRYGEDILHLLEYANGMRVHNQAEMISIHAVLRFCEFVKCHPLQVLRYPVIKMWDGQSDHEPVWVALTLLQGRWGM